MIDSLQGELWSDAYKHIFKINCLSSFVSSGNFFDASLPLNSTTSKYYYKSWLTYLFEMIRYIRRENHFCYYLSYAPVLSLWKQLEYIVLRVKQ